MKFGVFTVISVAPVLAHPSWYHPSSLPWAPSGPNDVRGPCPMLNTLANHGFLPHSGKGISAVDTVNALNSALNINQSLAQFLFDNAVTTNPAPNATTFSLENLDRHDILEHDASLSRADYYFGDDHTFNQTVFDETRSYWTKPIIDVQAGANARLARVRTSNATNPTFGFSQLGTEFSVGETAAYIIVLGDKTAGLVNRSFVEYLFNHERLPTELGWQRPTDQITTSDLSNMIDRVVNASSNASGGAALKVRQVDAHSGFHR